uniref:Fibrinogen C-terminal domain-containing protein n=1 Tax=Anopheles maculatus TaxID=74869 RepID=A0A182TBN7_9DIPT
MALWYIVLQCVIIGAVANENSLPINQIYSLAATLTTAESRILERIEHLSDKINKFNDRVDEMKRDISSTQLVLSETNESYKDKSLQHTSDSSCVAQNLSLVHQTETNKMFNTTHQLIGKLSEQLQNLTASSDKRMINVEHQLERLPEKTGVYFMQPNTSIPLNFTVSRDWTNNHGFGDNWIVFQRRSNGSLNFYRNWTEYKEGFGDVR